MILTIRWLIKNKDQTVLGPFLLFLLSAADSFSWPAIVLIYYLPSYLLGYLSTKK